MKPSLQPGIKHQISLHLPVSKMVPSLYPESDAFQQMPEVFATGYMVGFLEWAALEAVIPHIDWPQEQTVGTHVNVSHIAATPAGMAVTATAELIEVDGRRLLFKVSAHDGVDLISEGTHERFVINKDKFEQKLAIKRGQA